MKYIIRNITGLLLCLLLTLPVFAEQAQILPNDPGYSEQWALEAIDWLPVWQQGLTGKDVKIGIIDSGAYASHEDFQGANLSGYSVNNTGLDESVSFSNDVIGHGTFVTGMIAAQPNNGVGIVGIAPGAEIYAYRAFSDTQGSVEGVLHSIDQAIADGCRIINLSLGATEAELGQKSLALQRGIQKAQETGILVVAAAGNGKPSLTATLYPAGYEGVIGVGSVNETLERSSFSQTNDTVFVVAPGQNLLSLSHKDISGYATGRGTSYAAPIVTALAALALEYDPTLEPADITEMLRLTAVDLGEPGYDTSYGYGLVNAADLIAGFEGIFSVHYQLSAGELPENPPLTYQTDTGLASLPIPIRENYTFAGWYADQARTQPVTEIPADTRGQITLYDSWTANRNELLDYQDGVVSCLVKNPAQMLVAAYDRDGRLIESKRALVQPGTESVPLSVDESAFRIRVFLGASDSFQPLCEAWDSLAEK